MIFYITYGEHLSGIYSSQVVDTCVELSELSNKKIKLISFISIKHFFIERKKIKQSYFGAIVIPAFPKMRNYKLNIIPLFILCLIHKPVALIGRNAIPTKLALMLRNIKLIKKIVFDGRAAEYEQYVEYKLTNDTHFISQMYQNEKEVVNAADFKIAVSDALVNYWRTKFEYKKNTHVVIPCTLNTKNADLQDKANAINRKIIGYHEEDIVLIYSGSIAQWQSFSLLHQFFEEQLTNNKLIKVLFLSKRNDSILSLVEKYPNRVTQLWCNESEVYSYLSVADYGILLRESTWTNKVASPVKFAEYLNAGLDVIISPNVGDFSEYTIVHDCGFIYDKQYINLPPVTNIKRNKNKQLVKNFFTKKSTGISEKYKIILEHISC